MTVTWKKIRGVSLLLIAGLLLSSCINMAVESEFNEDGSARHTYRVTIERAMLDQFSGMGLEGDFDLDTDFQEAEEAARELGLDVERIDTDDEVGLRLTLEVDDNSDLGQVLNDLFSAGAEGGEVITAFSGAFSQDGDTNSLNLTIDGAALMGEEMETEGISADMLGNMITMTYTVRLPGEINQEETTGRILPDGRVQWDLPLSGTESFIASSQSESSGSSAGTILLVGFLLLLFIGGAVGLALFVYLRGRQTPAPVPVTTHDPDAPNRPPFDNQQG